MVHLPTDEWERGYAAGWRAAQADVVRDVTVDMGKSSPSKPKKRKRKASKYNLEYKRQYAKLKKKHPRTSFGALSKKAHTATKRALR